jgi:hypothetical protein
LKLKKRNENATNATPKKRGEMGKGTIERFGLKAIADALARAADVDSARENLSKLVNSVVEVSGKVQKRVKRDGQCKLVIEPGDVPGFVVFADCQPDAEKLRKAKIRKGSPVAVRGKFETFGAAAVCLSDCRLIGKK